MIDSFEIVQQNYNVNLTIIGEGKLKNELLQYIKKLGLSSKISILKYKNNIKKTFNRTSIFVLSSKFEGFGNVLVESLLYATPIVSTDCKGGPLEILKNGKYGYICKQNKFDMSDKIILAINDCKKDNIDYKNLQNRALDFTIEKIAKEYINI